MLPKIERFVGDHGLGLEVPNGKISPDADNIAVIGSGQAGLSAAYSLARKLYNVTIFESLPVVGGMLRVGIPEYRLPRNILDAEINSIKSLGVEIKNNVIFGKDVTADNLFQQGFLLHLKYPHLGVKSLFHGYKERHKKYKTYHNHFEWEHKLQKEMNVSVLSSRNNSVKTALALFCS